MIRIEEINDFSKLPVDSTEWNTLVHESESSTVFQTYEWISAYIKFYTQSNELLILLAYDGSRLIGIAPLQKFECLHFKFIKQKKIVFLGEIFSEYCDFIILPEFFDTTLKLFIDYIFQKYPQYPSLDFRDVPAESLTNRSLYGFNNYDLYQVKGEKYLFIDTSQSKEIYYSQFSKKTLNMINRKIEKLNNLNPKFVFSFSADEEEITGLSELNRKRISNKGQTSFFDTKINLNFMMEVSKSLSEYDMVLLSVCEIDSRNESFYLCFLYKNVVYFFISGFNMDYEKNSLGSMHLKVLIDHCFEAGYNKFDFLRGVDSYKFRFHPVESYTLRTIITRKGAASRIRKFIFKLAQTIKK